MKEKNKKLINQIITTVAIQLCTYVNLFILAIFTFLAVHGAINLFRGFGIPIAIFLIYFSFVLGYLIFNIAIKTLNKTKQDGKREQ